jgi:hypothetical protein
MKHEETAIERALASIPDEIRFRVAGERREVSERRVEPKQRGLFDERSELER